MSDHQQDDPPGIVNNAPLDGLAPPTSIMAAPHQQAAASSSLPSPTVAIPLSQPLPVSSSVEALPPHDDGLVDDDAGVIRCICGISDDDGFTIQCERCLVWQHCACFGMSSQSVPDEYLCEQCDPRDVNVAYAQAHQQRRRDQEARKAKAEKAFHERRQSEARSPATPSALARSSLALAPTAEDPPKAASPNEQLPSPASRHQQSSLAAPSRSRKPSQSLDLTNASFVLPDGASAAASANVGSAPTAKPARRKPGPKPGSRKTPLATPAVTPAAGSFTASRGAYAFPSMSASHDRSEDDAAYNVEKQIEAWHFDYTPITRNLLAEDRALDILAAALTEHSQGSPLKAQEIDTGHFVVPLASPSPDAIAEEEVVSSKDTMALQQSDQDASTAEAPPVDTPGAETPAESPPGDSVGISAIGNECLPIEIYAASLSAISSGVYVRIISEAASAAIFNNLLSIIPLPNDPARPWSSSKTFSRPPMHGLFAEDVIPAGAFVCEYRGELLSAEKYRSDPINQYHALGATKPHVHLLPPPLGLAVDARRFGTEARFARFGCHPNAVFRPILHYRTASDEDVDVKSRASTPGFTDIGAGRLPARDELSKIEPEIVFGLFALERIPRHHEIILGWEWDDQHIIHFLPELVKNPALETPERDRSTSALEMASKGDFPYASTVFSDKMNAATASLLGSTLCSCIGSATPQSGSGGHSASSNNARKQDCAVAQMLRVGQGMSLLNVNIPGSARNSQRRPRPPSFGPLVGVQRWWRSLSMPPTPMSPCQEGEVFRHLSIREKVLGSRDLPQTIFPGGKVARVMDFDLQRLIAEEEEAAIAGDFALCGAVRPLLQKEEAVAIANGAIEAVHYEPADAADEDVIMSEVDDEGAGSETDVSSLTEPLSGLSDIESDEDDSMLIRDDIEAAGDGNRDVVEDDGKDDDMPAVLPLKKRVAGTRLKANHIHGGDPDREDKTNRRNARKAERAAATIRAREAKEAKRRATLATRKARSAGRGKSRSTSRASPKKGVDSGESSSDDSDDEAVSAPPRSYRRKQKVASRKGNLVMPSSPLTSAPDDDTSDDAMSDAPSTTRLGSMPKIDTGDSDEDDEEEQVSTPTSHLRKVNKRLKNARAAENNSDSDEQSDSDGDTTVRTSSVLSSKRKKQAKKQSKAERRRHELAALADTESSVSDESESPRPKSKKRRMSVHDEHKNRGKLARARVAGLQDSESEQEERPPSPGASGSTPSSGLRPLPTTAQAGTEQDPAALHASEQQPSHVVVKHEQDVEEKPPVPDAPREPEKPRAKLSLADWKKQQAEKRKAAVEVASASSPVEDITKLDASAAPSTGHDDKEAGGTSDVHSLGLKALQPLPPTAPYVAATPPTSAPPSAPPRPSLPPAPLPVRSNSTFEAAPFSNPGSATESTLPPPALSSDRPVPQASSQPSSMQAKMPAQPASLSVSTSAPSDPVTSTSPVAWSPPPAPLPVRPSGPRMRAPSIAAASAKSPPTAPAALVASNAGPSPTQIPVDSGWGHRAGPPGAPSGFTPAASAGTPSFRPGNRWSISGPSSGSPPTSAAATSPPMNARATSPVNVNLAGPSRFAEPPSPRGLGNRPGLSLGPPAAPAAPAALRNSLGSGSSNAATNAVPFNPPKGPKALMNASAMNSAGPAGPNTGASGSNAISIRSSSVTSAGSPPTSTVDLPSGPSFGARSHERSPGSPPMPPTRHLSILGRGAAAAAAAASGSASDSSQRGNNHSYDYGHGSVDGGMSGSASYGSGWDRSSRERDAAGEEGRAGGGSDRWHSSSFDSPRGHRGHGHGPGHFGRGGWGGGGRGRGGGPGVEGGSRGGGWGARARGRGGRGGLG